MAFSSLSDQVGEIDSEKQWVNDIPPDIVLHMSEELGEISRQILKLSGYKKEEFDKQNLANEVVDLIYLAIKLSNVMEIDLDRSWNEMKQRYSKK